MLPDIDSSFGWNPYRLLSVVLIVGLVFGGMGAVAGTAVAHDDGDGLTVHNQTRPLDQHGEVHTLTVDRATADTEFYVDVHGPNGTLNETATYEAGTTLTDLELVLSPTITNETTVTVATHAANGTELANETITVTPVPAPTVTFSDQVGEFDAHDEVHTITVETVAANQEYYVDVHAGNRTLNTTRTFPAGTARTDLELALSPTLTSTRNVTVAVHATNGTELAAETATVTTVELDVSNQTAADGTAETITVDAVSAGTSYYVDVHGPAGDLNETATYEAGTRRTNLTLALAPTLANETTVTVAVHAADGTELAAQRITVDVAEQMTTATATATPTATSTATHTATPTGTPTEGGGAGFGAVVAALALLAAGLLVTRRRT